MGNVISQTCCLPLNSNITFIQYKSRGCFLQLSSIGMKLIHLKEQARPSVFLIWNVILKSTPCYMSFSNQCLWVDPWLRAVGITSQNACQFVLRKVMLDLSFPQNKQGGMHQTILYGCPHFFSSFPCTFAHQNLDAGLPYIPVSSSFIRK